MKKLRLTITLEYDDVSMHGDDEEAAEWFLHDVLNEIGDTIMGEVGGPEPLLLHSGAVRVLSVEDAE